MEQEKETWIKKAKGKIIAWLKTESKKWQFWAIAAVVFLVCVQILFSITAPYKWMEAAWGAGDFISFIGTIILGYIAVRQTQFANRTAEDANNTSRSLIQLQEEEYLPVVTVSSFVGITKHGISEEDSFEEVKAEMCSVEMRDSENHVLIGYSLYLFDDDTRLSEETYCRDYEVHFVYSGHFMVSSFKIKAIRFCGNDFEKVFTIPNSEKMSLCDKEELTLLIFLVSNEDFMQENSNSYKYLEAKYVILELEMVTMQGKEYIETITIRKMLIKEPEPTLNQPNIEMKLSAAYQVTGKTVKADEQ